MERVWKGAEGIGWDTYCLDMFPASCPPNGRLPDASQV